MTSAWREMTIKSRRGAPLGNRNARKHGLRSEAATRAKKLVSARLKAICLLGDACGIFLGRLRPRPLRLDQYRLLEVYDPELVGALVFVGIVRTDVYVE